MKKSIYWIRIKIVAAAAAVLAMGAPLLPAQSPVASVYVLDQQNGDGDNATATSSLVYFQGRYYGTTAEGGKPLADKVPRGTVFSVNTDGTDYQVLHTFYEDVSTTEGKTPIGRLVVSGPYVYGTASEGGANNGGTLFAIYSGSLYKLFDFPEGTHPGSLVASPNFVWGLASGSAGTPGSLFYFQEAVNIDNSHPIPSNVRAVHMFPGEHSNPDGQGVSHDGLIPLGDLAIVTGSGWKRTFGDYCGTDYAVCGVTSSGGMWGSGTVWSYHWHDCTPLPSDSCNTNPGDCSFFACSDCPYEVLYNFSGPDGGAPVGGLTVVRGPTVWTGSYNKSIDYLYGTTASGGLYGAGVVFAIGTDSDGGIYISPGLYGAAIHHFAVGETPQGALAARGGMLFGTTTYGGSSQSGTIYSIGDVSKWPMPMATPTAPYRTLYNFSSAPSDRVGSGPQVGLTFDDDGWFNHNRLVGTTMHALKDPSTLSGNGGIFKFDFPAISSSTFQPKIDLTTQAGPCRPAVADFDGDGRLDLVCANGMANTVTIYKNVGTNGSPISSSSFTAVLTNSVGSGGADPYWLATADVDGDGGVDLIVPDRNNHTIWIYKNTSSSSAISFAPPVGFDTGPNSDPRNVIFADLNNDGRLDMAVANYGTDTVWIWTNAASGISIATYPVHISMSVGHNPEDLVAVDLNDDGLLDLAVANFTGNSVSLFQNGSVAGLVFVSRGTISAPYGAISIVAGDIDGDGRPDLVVGSYYSQKLSIYQNGILPATNTFSGSSFVATDIPVSGYVHSVGIGDFNLDGKPDIGVVSEMPSHLLVFENKSNPGFVNLANWKEFLSGSDATGLIVTDLNRDGRSDAVFVNFYSGTMSIYDNWH